MSVAPAPFEFKNGPFVQNDEFDECEVEQKPVKMLMMDRFYQFAQAQDALVKNQPLTAAVYAFAGLLFGFPSLFTINPLVFIPAALMTALGAAIVHKAWENGQFLGLFNLARCAIDDAKSTIMKFRRGSGEG
jgi:hypothetical protein